MPCIVRVNLPPDTPGVLLYRNDSAEDKVIDVRIAHEGGFDKPIDAPLQARVTMRKSGVSFWKRGETSTTLQVEEGDEVWASAMPEHRIVAMVIAPH